MKSRTLALLMVAFTALVSVTPTLAQQGNASNDWATVMAVSPGEKLSVELKDGKKIKGRLRTVSDSMLTLDRDSKSSDLSRDSISRVYRLVGSAGKSVGKAAAIGAGIGAGAGIGVGIASGGYETLSRGEVAGILGVVGAGIGAGIGAIVGGLGSKETRVLVYQSN
jgi:small nuclear ribonucleoprotein (snRNP)-like protein